MRQRYPWWNKQIETLQYSEFISEVQRDQVSKVVIDGLTITGERPNGTQFETVRPMLEDPKLIDDLLQHRVVVEGRKPEQQSLWTQLLVACFPILIIIAVFMFSCARCRVARVGAVAP